MWWEPGIVLMLIAAATYAAGRHVHRTLKPSGGGCACIAPCGDLTRLKERANAHATR